MYTEYGSWSYNTKVHAVGYDGKWLCGRKRGKTASECGGDVSWVDCKLCKKRLPKYLQKKYIDDEELTDLKNALKSLQGFIERNPEHKNYLKSWVEPYMKNIILKLEEEVQVK